MTREECEKQITGLLKQVLSVANQYDHNIDYLDMFITRTSNGDRRIMFNNNYWERDKKIDNSEIIPDLSD